MEPGIVCYRICKKCKEMYRTDNVLLCPACLRAICRTRDEEQEEDTTTGSRCELRLPAAEKRS